MRRKRPRRLMDPDPDEMTPVETHRRIRSSREVANALCSGGQLDDRDFDRFLPAELRRVSGQHWTPLVVVSRVAQWLDSLGIRTVVDIGAGAGKFCVAAALASRCEFTGIEQRSRLIAAARGLARAFGVGKRVSFIQGTLSHGQLPDADAYYLYNPFGENLYGPEAHLDHDVELSEDRYERDVALTEQLLERTRTGTYVIKYNGFGGLMPASYTPIRVDREMPSVLRLWQKTGPTGELGVDD